jgi:hypothetical protein
MSGELVYDPVANPYAPGAGTPPPALVGRDAELETARVALARTLTHRSAQHLLLHGLRGVGKTVLLRAVSGLAERDGYHVLHVEGDPHGDAVGALVRQSRRILADAQPTPKVRRALQILKSVSVSLGVAEVSVGLEEPAGSGRAGAVAEDLPELLVALAVAVADDGAGVGIVVDEAQVLPLEQLAAVLGALHAAGQRQLPLWGALAGLPNLLGRAAKAKTYAERMFTVAELGPLGRSPATAAVREPAAELGVSFSRPALDAIVLASAGYPYFLQTWAYHTWNVARDDPISKNDVVRAGPAVQRALDDGFFAARVARVPESERRYLRALAALGPGAHPSRAVAEALGSTTPGVGALRDRLITDGVIYSPAYGQVALALPLLDDYLRRSRI